MELLLVQPYEDYQYSYQSLYDEIKEIISNHSVDLVVFPEGFAQMDSEENAWATIEYIADYLDKPVLLAFTMDDGLEMAFYLNWKPSEGETEDKIYIKHSTAAATIFDFDFSKEVEAEIYSPIILKGKRIQVNICHDMFFPLITERLEQEGADLFINLTGGNVRMSKWCNVLKGRSIESDSYHFCTMGNRVGMNQPSDRIGYFKGHKIAPIYEMGNGKREHAFSIFSTEGKQEYLVEPPAYYSDKLYDQFTIGVNGQADCIIDLEEGTIRSSLTMSSKGQEHTFHFVKGKENVQVSIAKYSDLFNRAFLYEKPQSAGFHQVMVYMSDEKVDIDPTIALMKLRVIENRVAVVVATPNLLIGAKTNRYKDVQLFQSTNEQIGFDLQHMLGTQSVFQKSNSSQLGIPLRHKDRYESIVAE